MTDTEFTRRLDRLGSDLSAWPAAERHAAEKLLAASSHARAAHRRAEEVDHLLRLDPAPVIDERRVARLLAATMTAIAAQERQGSLFGRLLDRLIGGWAPQLGTAALFGLLGLAAGLVVEQQPMPVYAAALPDLLITVSSLEGLVQ